VNVNKVISRDGTAVAYDQSGQGDPVILVSGALGYRAFSGADRLTELLAQHFIVINYDRRGRGDSGDTPPYAVQREVEDIEALVDAVGGSAYLYGISSGAVLALEAASKLPTRVKKLAMYEPPFIIDDSRPPVPQDYQKRLEDATAAGRPGDAVEIFMTDALRIPAEFVAQMRNAPTNALAGDDSEMKPPEWAKMEKVAHTLAYDAAIVGDNMSGQPLSATQWASTPASTLVITGGNSETFFHTGAKALVDVLPDARHRVLEGQDHAVAPDAIAPMLVAFFKG
jgi:pimeloyl-ACP methyl ester carboxylesterase